jgi:hypothetical protein
MCIYIYIIRVYIYVCVCVCVCYIICNTYGITTYVILYYGIIKIYKTAERLIQRHLCPHCLVHWSGSLQSVGSSSMLWVALLNSVLMETQSLPGSYRIKLQSFSWYFLLQVTRASAWVAEINVFLMLLHWIYRFAAQRTYLHLVVTMWCPGTGLLTHCFHSVCVREHFPFVSSAEITLLNPPALRVTVLPNKACCIFMSVFCLFHRTVGDLKSLNGQFYILWVVSQCSWIFLRILIILFYFMAISLPYI